MWVATSVFSPLALTQTEISSYECIKTSMWWIAPLYTVNHGLGECILPNLSLLVKSDYWMDCHTFWNIQVWLSMNWNSQGCLENISQSVAHLTGVWMGGQRHAGYSKVLTKPFVPSRESRANERFLRSGGAVYNEIELSAAKTPNSF